jgi:SAM-dependent methyltransferase
MKHVKDAWNEDYIKRGRLWGGTRHSIPDLPKGCRILELGCGNGTTLSGLLKHRYELVAIDFSDEATQISKKIVDKNPCTDVIVADARQLPFATRSFDAIIAFHIVGHMLQDCRELVIRDSIRVLRKGGQLFFRDFSVNDMRAGSGVKVEPDTYCRGLGIFTHYFDENEVLSLFAQLNVQSLTSNRWTMRIHGKNVVRAEIVAFFSK